MTVVTDGHARLLAKALADVLGPAATGSLAYVRCLPGEIIDALLDNLNFAVDGYAVYAVVDTTDAERRSLTADKAVERREDKHDALILFIDQQRAGAGLDGIYSAGREIGEADLFDAACRKGREALRRGTTGFSRDAVRVARRIGQQTLLTPWQEFDFLVDLSQANELGRTLVRLGLWPVAADFTPTPQELDLSCLLVNRLLTNRAPSMTVHEKVASLALDEQSGTPSKELESFLQEVRFQTPQNALIRLLDRPVLWLNAIKPMVSHHELQSIQLLSWWKLPGRNLLKWCGLQLAAPGEPPRLIIDRSHPNQSRLEVRWQTTPEQLPNGATEYDVAVMAGTDVLASRTVSHRARQPQKAAFLTADFEDLDDKAKFHCFVRVTAIGNEKVEPQDSEEFILEIGLVTEEEKTVTSGRTVRCFIESLITLPDEDVFEITSREFQKNVTEDKKGYLTWHAPQGRSFRVYRPPLITQIEHCLSGTETSICRWRVRVRGDGSRVGEPQIIAMEPGACTKNVWDRLRAAHRVVASEAGGPGWLARVHVPSSPPVDEYLLAWLQALEQANPELSLSHTIEVRSLSDQPTGLIVLPWHPLRVAWQWAYEQLAVIARFDQGGTPKAVTEMLHELDSAHFPAFMPGLVGEESFVFGDMLGFAAAAMVSDRNPEPKAAISLLAACLGEGQPGGEVAPSVGSSSVDALAREVKYYLNCHSSRGEGEFEAIHQLRVHAFRAGDGETICRALGSALEGRRDVSRDYDDGSERKSSDLCFTLDLFPSEQQGNVAGRFLLDVARRRRAAAGVIDQRDRWMLQTLQRPGGVLQPRLQWAKRSDERHVAPAHLSFAFDSFQARVEAVPQAELSEEPRPLHGFGLVNYLERAVNLADPPTWQTFMPPRFEGEKLEPRSLVDRLLRLHDLVARATTSRLGGTRPSWPVLTTRLDRESIEKIETLHRASDWVVTADKNACVEYFDSPNDQRGIYDAYVIDCVPERSDLGCLQLVTSTCNIDEVRNLLDGMLGEMGLSSSQRNCTFVLDHLKGLSGRLAIRLASPATKTGELIALSLARAQSKDAQPGDPVWCSLDEGFFIPLDEISDTIGPSASEDESNERADLVYVTAQPRGALEFRFVEVKYRRHIRMARDPSLIEKMAGQLARTSTWWREHYFGKKLTKCHRAIRRSSLARVLYFYVDKARRHGLKDEMHRRYRREIDKLVRTGDSYEAILDGPNKGYVFCPEYRAVGAERIYSRSLEGLDVFLFGAYRLPEAGLRTTDGTFVPTQGKASETQIIEADIDELATTALTLKGDVSTQSVNDGAPTCPLPSGPEENSDAIFLGEAIGTDNSVCWRPTIQGNPHLMIVGLPGMGKTTCLINICRQLKHLNIMPIIFSYHKDIEERLHADHKDLNFVDYDGLGFNPLQVDPNARLSHIDVASELRDIFSAIFPDLGDLQTEEIRQAIKQSYLDLGWGSDSHDKALSAPPFKAFFDILSAKAKPNPGLMARLSELADYNFFSSSGSSRSLLDTTTPTVIRIHETANDLLQRAFSSFVLYSLYKDMFKRGVQSRMTHTIIFDEAHRASRLKLLPTMAKESRKYGLALVLASQEARDFDSSLFSNIASFLCLRVTETDAKAIAKSCVSSDIEKRLIDRLKQLDKFTAFFMSEGLRRPSQVRLTPA